MMQNVMEFLILNLKRKDKVKSVVLKQKMNGNVDIDRIIKKLKRTWVGHLGGEGGGMSTKYVLGS